MSEITKEELQELRRLAEKATPGPWKQLSGWTFDANNEFLQTGYESQLSDADSAYIAYANPERIGRLLDAVEDRWIPVSERLPDAEDVVLTTGKSSNPYFPYEVAACRALPMGGRYWTNSSVTPSHWRPIPTPPVKRGEKEPPMSEQQYSGINLTALPEQEGDGDGTTRSPDSDSANQDGGIVGSSPVGPAPEGGERYLDALKECAETCLKVNRLVMVNPKELLHLLELAQVAPLSPEAERDERRDFDEWLEKEPSGFREWHEWAWYVWQARAALSQSPQAKFSHVAHCEICDCTWGFNGGVGDCPGTIRPHKGKQHISVKPWNEYFSQSPQPSGGGK